MDLGELYERCCSNDSDIFEHLPTLYGLCKELNAQRVLELGVRSGVSTVAWLHGLDSTGGHLWSVDVNEAPENLPRDNWTFILGDDQSAEVADQLVLTHLFDILFIDTSHAFGHTLAELELYAPRVRPGGRIVLHDTEIQSPDLIHDNIDFPVRSAIETYCSPRGWLWENRTNNNGLGIVAVPDAPLAGAHALSDTPAMTLREAHASLFG